MQIKDLEPNQRAIRIDASNSVANLLEGISSTRKHPSGEENGIVVLEDAGKTSVFLKQRASGQNTQYYNWQILTMPQDIDVYPISESDTANPLTIELNPDADLVVYLRRDQVEGIIIDHTLTKERNIAQA